MVQYLVEDVIIKKGIMYIKQFDNHELQSDVKVLNWEVTMKTI